MSSFVYSFINVVSIYSPICYLLTLRLYSFIPAELLWVFVYGLGNMGEAAAKRVKPKEERKTGTKSEQSERNRKRKQIMFAWVQICLDNVVDKC